LVVDKELFVKVGLGAFKLVDLTITDDSEILKHKKLALLEMLLKHIRVKEFIQVTEQILDALTVAHMDSLPKHLFDSMLSYLTKAKEQEDLKPLFNGIIDKFTDYKEGVMTYAEQYTQQGKQEAQREIAKELLKSGVDESIIAKAAHLSVEEIRKLKQS